MELGKNVWVIVANDVKKMEECSFCDGEKTIEGKDNSTEPCPVCKGDGELLNDIDIEWVVYREFKVNDMLVSMKQPSTGDPAIDVFYKCGAETFPDNNCYSTEIEAQEACNELNSSLCLKLN